MNNIGHSSASPYKPVGASSKPTLFTSRDKMLRQATHRSSIPTSTDHDSPSAFANPPNSAKYLPKTPSVKSPNQQAVDKSSMTPNLSAIEKGAAAPGLTNNSEKEDMLQLEHVIGFTGAYRNTCVGCPLDDRKYITSMGSMIVVGNDQDPHDQLFFRGHDMEVSAIAVSTNGMYIASAQIGTIHRKGHHAPVILWSYHNKQELFYLEGLTHNVSVLQFSPDNKLLLAIGSNNEKLMIWDVVTGETIYSNRYPHPISTGTWCSTYLKGRRTAYELAFAMKSEMIIYDLWFDPARVQWTMSGSPCTLPCTGVKREYICATVTKDGDYLLAGTSVGDMCVFKLSARVFRASIPICSAGLRSMVSMIMPIYSSSREENSLLSRSSESTGKKTVNVVICGGGDGSVKKIVGSDLRWELIAETRVGKAVTSLSTNATCQNHINSHSSTTSTSSASSASIQNYTSSGIQEIICGTAGGCTYKLLADDLTAKLTSISPTSPISTVCVCPVSSDLVATGSNDGTLHIWDLNTYTTLSTAYEKTSQGLTCIDWLNTANSNNTTSTSTTNGQMGGSSLSHLTVLCGYNDSFLRAFEATTGRKKWHIPNAHRGAVTSIASTSKYIVTGGSDGGVRVWGGGKGRELLIQWVEHMKPVTRVLVDNSKINLPSSSSDQQILLHSCSEDCTLLTYSLKLEKRINSHTAREGSFLDMVQRTDGEHEMITVDALSRVVAWDESYPNPVSVYIDPSQTKLCATALSPCGKYLATAGLDTSIKILYVESVYATPTSTTTNIDGPISVGLGHSANVTSLCWTPDGRQLISVSEDSTICVWNFYDVTLG